VSEGSPAERRGAAHVAEYLVDAITEYAHPEPRNR